MYSQEIIPNSLQTNAISPFSEIREKQENSPQTRGDDGKFIAGVSGNPGGRPKSKHITEAYKAILEDEGADKYARVVAGIAVDSTAKDSDRLAAVQEITDRVEGKATQRMDVRGLICMMPAEGVMSTLDEWAGDE